jgi:hypothetical protein
MLRLAARLVATSTGALDDMANTAIAITAIVVSGVVGPSLSAWWSRGRQRDDHQRELRLELAIVLDEGINALGRAHRCYWRIYDLYVDGVDREAAEAREAFAERPVLMQDVRYGGDRIAIRLGADHAVHRAYVRCVRALDSRFRFAHAYERGSAIEHELERQLRAHAEFDSTRAAFVGAARKLVGPKLD